MRITPPFPLALDFAKPSPRQLIMDHDIRNPLFEHGSIV